jgi:hypothetical protein
MAARTTSGSAFRILTNSSRAPRANGIHSSDRIHHEIQCDLLELHAIA